MTMRTFKGTTLLCFNRFLSENFIRFARSKQVSYHGQRQRGLLLDSATPRSKNCCSSCCCWGVLNAKAHSIENAAARSEWTVIRQTAVSLFYKSVLRGELSERKPLKIVTVIFLH
jgi:hypothetical protein